MEGMISKEMLPIQREYIARGGSRMTIVTWTHGLVVKLMEVTHGQWLYRNVHVHDFMTGVHATQRKEALQREIEDQIELGGEGLEDADKYLLEINLDDLETTSGDTQEYWLLSIIAAREARILRERDETRAAAGDTT